MVKEWIANHRPNFGAYLETHIQPLNTRRIINALPRGWKFLRIKINIQQQGLWLFGVPM